MTLNVLFAALPERWEFYRDSLNEAFQSARLEVRLQQDFEPEVIDYIVYAPNGPVMDFRPFTRAKAVLSLWAGVESIVGNSTLTQPLSRMVDSGLSEGMVEWVTGHVLRHHLGLDRYIRGAPGWDPVVPPLARHRAIGILGLGELGQACAHALTALNFPVSGWSRSAKTIDGITCLHDEDGLRRLLSDAEILVLLLPLTPETENLMNRERFSLMPKGAVLLNPGRGALIDDNALIDALDSGRIANATLDVFRIEPLPQDHPFWSHPRVTVTPHIASETRAETASLVIAENIRRSEAGEQLLFLVDRVSGY